MAYFGIEDQSFGFIILIVETLIIISLTYAVAQARRLRTDVHQKIVIVTYLVQGLVLITWMGRRFLEGFAFLSSRGLENTWNVFLHVIIGTIVALLATGWIIAMFADPEIHVAKMKRGKPLMRTVYGLWVFNYFLGMFNYLNRYYLEWV